MEQTLPKLAKLQCKKKRTFKVPSLIVWVSVQSMPLMAISTIWVVRKETA